MANERARALRRNQTNAERLLWARLKCKRDLNLRFRRQHPLGPYIVDFVCLQKRLIIELDGDQHGLPAGEAHDRRRDAWLEGEGFRVLRFWNEEVYREIDGVLARVEELLGDPTY